MRQTSVWLSVGFCLVLASMLLAQTSWAQCTPGEVCRPAAGPCDIAEVCTPTGECPPDSFHASDHICHAATACSDEVRCIGNFATCPAIQYKPKGHLCHNAAGVCDQDAYCLGDSTVCPNAFRPNTYLCRPAVGNCDRPEYCNGSSPLCLADGFEPAGTQCRAAAGDCDHAAVCDGYSPACPSNTYKSGATPCRAASDCSDAMNCTGSVALCPESHKPQGTPCTDDGLLCTSDLCDGAGQCVHTPTEGCAIGGVCVDEDESAPGNDCLVCNTAMATDAYSPKAAGEPCEAGGSCDGFGLCASKPGGSCTIEGVFFESGAANPENECRSCNPSMDTTAWTDRAPGTPCGKLSSQELCDGAGRCVKGKSGGGCSTASGGGALLLALLGWSWVLLRRRH